MAIEEETRAGGGEGAELTQTQGFPHPLGPAGAGTTTRKP